MPIEADHEAVSPARAAAGDGRGRLAADNGTRRASFLNIHVTMTHETSLVLCALRDSSASGLIFSAATLCAAKFGP